MKDFSLLCVDTSKDLFKRLHKIIGINNAYFYWETRVDRLIEWFESRNLDILVITGDAMETDSDALDIISLIAQRSPGTVILTLVNDKQLNTAIEIMQSGGYLYAKLPLDDNNLKFFLTSAYKNIPLYSQNFFLSSGVKKNGFGKLLGISEIMKELYDQTTRAAMMDMPVLITGETGTGKDLVAQAIHNMGDRKTRPFVPVHLGTLPTDLVPGELFGHEKGAFTGATEKKKSIFEKAEKGTVFLDEISTTNEKVQVSLLRLIENREFYRIGGSNKISTDVRILAATNLDLHEAVMNGQFREDLYYRLNVFCINLPPLRDRKGDIQLLTRHFINQYGEYMNKRISGISDSCMHMLEAYDWPGNVRDLKNLIQRAVVQCDGKKLLERHFPERIRIKSLEKKQSSFSFPMGTPLGDVEKEMIKQTLVYTGNNKKRAAELLGISRRTLYNKL
ncbi:MAG: sigma-54 dependent transcriptional regulator [Desulfobacteraceae bacterium]|jgi:DNA-binding NtrC family response regulator|nr:sigma-54 dependent transcriptional regulator [Desulfobacteraceae bacterium]